VLSCELIDTVDVSGNKNSREVGSLWAKQGAPWSSLYLNILLLSGFF